MTTQTDLELAIELALDDMITAVKLAVIAATWQNGVRQRSVDNYSKI